MADVGIVRFNITDEVNGAGAWRFKDSRARWPLANQLYRAIFSNIGSPLLDGEQVIECSKEEFAAGYDYELGIDVILTIENQSELTLQEKFLYTNFGTVTVEYMQNPATGEQGDWFNMRPQLYFVGYDSLKAFVFNEWAMLSWPTVQITNSITWNEARNGQDGARASFLYARFCEFPSECVIAINTQNYHPSLFGSSKMMSGLTGENLIAQ